MTQTYETEVPGAAVEPVAPSPVPPRPVRRWPLAFIGAPAAVAVWSGWVGLGQMCGFGIIHPLPGIVDSFQLNTAITLPIGVEAYGAYALGVWLRPGGVSATARTFAKRSAVGALVLGMAGQVIYHLLAASHEARAPWPVVMLVSCLPVVAIGMGAALTHLLHDAAPVRAPEPIRSAAAFPRVDTAPVRVGSEPEQTALTSPVQAPVQAGPVRIARITPVRTEPAPSGTARTDTREDEGAGVAGQREFVPPLRRIRWDGDVPAAAAPLADADRSSVVEMVADQIRDAVEAGEVWRPDYPALMDQTGRRRSWCEKVVRDARDLVMTPPDDPDAGTGAVRTDDTDPYGGGDRTGNAVPTNEDRTDELASAGTS